MSDSTLIMCKNGGCLKKFNPTENKDDSCKYHSGKPIFHDLKKGWTCCNVIVYDWDEFEKIEGCTTGKHLEKKVKKETTNQGEFFQSNTVNRAKGGIENHGAVQSEVKNIEDFNKQEEKRKELEKKEEEKKEKKYFLTKNGKWRCTNKGCAKEFVEEDNCDGACKYHVGAPVFHDLKKYWSCCAQKETWDWDEFMKIPTCAEGRHIPKMV